MGSQTLRDRKLHASIDLFFLSGSYRIDFVYFFFSQKFSQIQDPFFGLKKINKSENWHADKWTFTPPKKKQKIKKKRGPKKFKTKSEIGQHWETWPNDPSFATQLKSERWTAAKPSVTYLCPSPPPLCF